MTRRRTDASLIRREDLSEFGSKGGKAAAAKMTAAERSARAKRAVAAREAKRKTLGT